MQEVIITSGRHLDHIDPYLTIWGWEVPVYLFLGGLVGGMLFFSALFYLLGKAGQMKTTVATASVLSPVLLGIGLFALFLDLEYKTHVHRFFMAFRIESPMSWGSWTLGVIFPLSAIWALVHIETVFPKYGKLFSRFGFAINLAKRIARPTAWMIIAFAVLLGMYTGILLSAFNARPLWNTAILGPLFLVSGLSTGTALSMILSKDKHEKHILSRIDLGAIGVEIFLIIHMFMGLLASTQVHIDAAELFLGGPFTAAFWVLVFGMGLFVPAMLELFELRGKRIPAAVPASLVLIGGLALRFVIVDAGQFSTWLPY